MTIDRLNIEDFQIDYFKFGEGEKVMVILPGLSIKNIMLSANVVAKDYAPIAKDFKIYLIDRRVCPEDHTTIESMASDTEKALDKLGLKDIYLFGASQGGMLAMQVALDRPDLVKKMALGSTSAKIENTIILDRWIELAKKKDREGLYLDFGKCIYPQALYKRYERPLRIISKSVSNEELERFVKIANATRDFNILNEVKNIKCETLAIGAKDDIVLGGYATEDIAKAMGCELYMYEEGYGHAAFDTAPDYKQRLLDFYRKWDF